MAELDPHFTNLSSELLYCIARYLSNAEFQQLSQVCSTLRPLFLSLSFERCIIGNVHTDPYSELKGSTFMYTINFPINDRVLPPRIFLNPEKYSWFLNESVKSIRFMDMEFPWKEENTKSIPEFTKPYPKLVYLGFYTPFRQRGGHFSFYNCSFAKCKFLPSQTEQKRIEYIDDERIIDIERTRQSPHLLNRHNGGIQEVFDISKFLEDRENSFSNGYLDFFYTASIHYYTDFLSYIIFDQTKSFPIVKKLTLDLLYYNDKVFLSKISSESNPLLPDLPNLQSLSIIISDTECESVLKRIFETIRTRKNCGNLCKLDHIKFFIASGMNPLFSEAGLVRTLCNISEMTLSFKTFHIYNQIPLYINSSRPNQISFIDPPEKISLSSMTSYSGDFQLFAKYITNAYELEELEFTSYMVSSQQLFQRFIHESLDFPKVTKLESNKDLYPILELLPNLKQLKFNIGDLDHFSYTRKVDLETRTANSIFSHLTFIKLLSHYGFGNFSMDDKTVLGKIVEEVLDDYERVESEYKKLSPFHFTTKGKLKNSFVKMLVKFFSTYTSYKENDYDDDVLKYAQNLHENFVVFEKILRHLPHLETLCLSGLGDFNVIFTLHKLIRHHPRLKTLAFEGSMCLQPKLIENICPLPEDEFYNKLLKYTRRLEMKDTSMDYTAQQTLVEVDDDDLDPGACYDADVPRHTYSIDVEGIRKKFVTSDILRKDYVYLTKNYSGIYFDKKKKFRHAVLADPLSYKTILDTCYDNENLVFKLF